MVRTNDHERRARLEAWNKRDREAAMARLAMVGIVNEKPTLLDRIKGYFVRRKLQHQIANNYE